MMHMDAGAVKSIQRRFVAAGGSVDLYGFVDVMRRHLPEYSNAKAVVDTQNDAFGGQGLKEASGGAGLQEQEGSQIVEKELDWLKDMTEEERERELVADLVELFREVDINGDGDMEWDEFTRFIVEKASLFQVRGGVEGLCGFLLLYCELK